MGLPATLPQMVTARKYTGCLTPHFPEEKPPSKAETLRFLYSFNNGSHKGFKISKVHCNFAGNKTVSCSKGKGCISTREKCTFQVLMDICLGRFSRTVKSVKSKIL